MAQTDAGGGNPLWRDAQAALDARQYESAVPLLTELADRGSLRAAHLLGDIYGEGRLGDADYDSARRWWRMAAMGGVAEAQYNLAVTYREGQGTPVDLEEAIRWYREAADRGDHGAKYQLGQLLLAHTDASRHPDGYMYMRLALIAGTDGSALATSLMRSDYQHGSTAFTALRAEAVSGLWSRLNADPANPLNNVTLVRADPPAWPEPPRVSEDRDEGLSYVIDHFMRALFGIQDQTGHLRADDRPGDAAISFSKAMVVYAGLYAHIGRDVTGRAAILYPLYTIGTKAESNTAAFLTRDQLWSIVRPGDVVLLSDQLNQHLTYVYGVDRSANRLTLLDTRPDEFMLLEGRNAVGARAQLSDDGISRRLVTITGEEFRDSVSALATAGSAEFPAVLMAAFPDLAGDWRMRLSFGAALLNTYACRYLDAAAAHLAIAYKLAAGVDAASQPMIADRALLTRVVSESCAIAGALPDESATHLEKVPDGDGQSLSFSEIKLLCFLLLNQGRIDEARAYAQNRLKSAPEAPDGQLLLALIDMEIGALDDAASRLSEAIDQLETLLAQSAGSNPQLRATPADRDLWADMLVLAYVDRGSIVIEDDPESAYQDGERALALSPGFADAIRLVRDAGRLSGHLQRVSELHGRLRDRDIMTPLHELYGLID